MKNVKLFYSVAILIWVFSYISYISWILSGASFLIYTIFYYFVFYIFHIIWSIIFKKNKKSLYDFLLYFINRISLFLLFIFGFFLIFIYYQNIYSPALLPEFTMTNGKKTVIFQWMAHIGSESFYSQIKENIRKQKNDWYTLFFEWVKPWTEEESKEFNKLLWIKFDKETYTNLSKLYNLKAQNNHDFLTIVNNKDVNVDIWISDILKIYKKRFWTWIVSDVQDLPINVTSLTNELINQLNEKELSLFVNINRAIMNMIIKDSWLRDSIIATSSKKDIFSVILEDRNKILADKIINGNEDKIYVLYWLMHFDWVLELLQNNDSNWNVTSARFFKPID